MNVGRSGFTLLEMLVVIGILGLVAGIGYPSITKSIEGQEFRTMARQVDLAVRQVRADAVRQQRTLTVPKFAEGRDATVVPLISRSSGQVVTIDQPAILRFYRDGTTNGGRIALKAGARTFEIVIDPQTGLVTSGMQ